MLADYGFILGATRDELLKAGRRVALAPLQRNELILKTKITGPGQRASLSSLLDEVQRCHDLCGGVTGARDSPALRRGVAPAVLNSKFPAGCRSGTFASCS